MGLVDAMGPLAGTIRKQHALSGFMVGRLPAFAFVAFAVFRGLSLRGASQAQPEAA